MIERVKLAELKSVMDEIAREAEAHESGDHARQIAKIIHMTELLFRMQAISVSIRADLLKRLLSFRAQISSQDLRAHKIFSIASKRSQENTCAKRVQPRLKPR